MFRDLPRAHDGRFSLPVEEESTMEPHKHNIFMDLACAHDGLSPLLVEEKSIMESDKHEMFMNLACAYDRLFSLPVSKIYNSQAALQSLQKALYSRTKCKSIVPERKNATQS